MKQLKIFLMLGSFFFIPVNALANVGETFGFGSRVASLANAGVSWGSDSYWAYYNPAGLSMEKEKRLQMGLAMLYMQPIFRPISNVVTQNTYTGDGDQTGDVDTTYRATQGTSFGLSYRIFPEWINLTTGVTTYLPLNQVAYMDTGEPYVPEYVLYRARTQRPQLDLGVGGELGKGIHFGLGLHLAFSLTSNASVFINTPTNSISTMRFVASMSPQFAPYFGVLYTPQENPQLFSLGGVFRFPAASNNVMVLNSSAQVLPGFGAADFTFTALSTLFYDPMSIEIGGSWQHAQQARFFAQLDYQFWSNFQPPALVIQQQQGCQLPGGKPCTVTIAPGAFPAMSFINVWIPRVGEEITISDVSTLRFGYAYRPSFLDGVSNGSGNYLDPPKHMLHLGWGLKFQHFLHFETPCQLDLHLGYQYLVLQHIVKTAGNEAGNANDPKIGSPGYDAGGNIFGGGISLSMAL